MLRTVFSVFVNLIGVKRCYMYDFKCLGAKEKMKGF